MLFVLLILYLSIRVESYNNGFGKLPVMGWNTWYQYGCDVNETLILEMMNGLKKYGLDKYGYEYINIDDCWALKDRDPRTRKVVADPTRFPNGMKYIADQMHQNGLKFGLYTDIGSETCGGRAGSGGHYEIDAHTYVEWGIDFIKVDFCHTTREQAKEPWIYYGNFSHHINATGHHMFFSVCNWGVHDPWKWAGKISNMWRTTQDLGAPLFSNVLRNMEENAVLEDYGGLYGYNNPDILQVGVISRYSKKMEQLSMNENRAHFSLWCLMASPLLLANDLRNIPSDVLEIITNSEVIAINQDELGLQGKVVKKEQEWIVDKKCVNLVCKGCCKWVEIWKKTLSNGKIAVGMFNHADASQEDSKHFKDEFVTVTWKELGLSEEKEYHVRDVWKHEELGSFRSELKSTKSVKQHDIFLVVMTPVVI